MQKATQIFKIGGSCLHTPADLDRVLEISRQTPDAIIVLSALNGLTDMLIGIAKAKADGQEKSSSGIMEFISKFYNCIDYDKVSALNAEVTAILDQLDLELNSICLQKSVSEKSMAAVQSVGERITVPIVKAYLDGKGVAAKAFDEQIFRVEGPLCDSRFAERGKQSVRDALAVAGIKLVPGFVGRNEYGAVATLGRGGSDYTATWIGALFHKAKVTLFKDEGGIFSADPKIVPEAKLIQDIGFPQAEAIARAGGKVLCEKAIGPLKGTGVELLVRGLNSRNGVGTRVGEGLGQREEKLVVCSRDTKTDFAEISVVGPKEIVLSLIVRRQERISTINALHSAASSGRAGLNAHALRTAFQPR